MSFAGNVFEIGDSIKFSKDIIISAVFRHRKKIIYKLNQKVSFY